MKKLLGLILAVGLMFGVAGQAMAAFTQNDLMMVVYNEDDKEVAINLGDVSEIDFTATNVTLLEAGTLTLDLYGDEVDDWDDLSLAFLAADTEAYNYWFATTKDTISGISVSSLSSAMSGIASLYSTYGDDDIHVASSSSTISYDNKINSASTSTGTYGGINTTDAAYGEADLAALLTDGYVDMYLYHYSIITLDTGADETTQYTAILRLYADGSVVLNPTSSAVPIPASVLLFGSGLLGLFGIRRKKA